MRILAFLTDPPVVVVSAILLSPRPAPPAPAPLARAWPPQGDFLLDQTPPSTPPMPSRIQRSTSTSPYPPRSRTEPDPPLQGALLSPPVARPDIAVTPWAIFHPLAVAPPARPQPTGLDRSVKCDGCDWWFLPQSRSANSRIALCLNALPAFAAAAGSWHRNCLS